MSFIAERKRHYAQAVATFCHLTTDIQIAQLIAMAAKLDKTLDI